MDTKVTQPGPLSTPPRAPQQTASADARAAAPEKVETPQAVTAADRIEKPALQQSAPSSALTTYKDQDSGRLIVRVYDRESGDVLVEFPPERAFRAAPAAPEAPARKPGKGTSA